MGALTGNDLEQLLLQMQRLGWFAAAEFQQDELSGTCRIDVRWYLRDLLRVGFREKARRSVIAAVDERRMPGTRFVYDFSFLPLRWRW